MKKAFRGVASVLCLALLLTMFGFVDAGNVQSVHRVQAATKPAKPEFNVSLTDNYGEALITINKTSNADGYRIYIKAPGAKKYQKLTSIAKNGTKKRSYTATKLVTGTYCFRVRAYSKASGKTVWSSYSAVKKLEMIDAETRAHIDRMNELAADEYPDLYTMVEDGKLGLTMDDASNVYFTLGSYDMIDQLGNREKKDIEWIVLDYDEDEGKALLLSKYCVDKQQYNDTFTDVTWETCSLRTWLNETFLYNAFSEKERKDLILRSDIKNSKNNSYGVNGGNDTKDRVFVLSTDEAHEYSFPTKATLYNGVAAGYWLRTPGNNYLAASFITEGGALYTGSWDLGKLEAPSGRNSGWDWIIRDYAVRIYGNVDGARSVTVDAGNGITHRILGGTRYWPIGGSWSELHPDYVRPAIWINLN